MIQFFERKKYIFGSVWIVAMLYLSRDSIFNRLVIGFYPAYLIQFLISAGMLLYLLWDRRSTMKSLLHDWRVMLVPAMSLVYILPMLIKHDWQFMYLSVLFALLIPVLVSFFVDMKTLARCYIGVMCVLACCSLLNAYILRLPADRHILSVPSLGDNSFYNFWLSVVSVRSFRFRNFGIFREPGVYQFFLLLAVYLNLEIAQFEKASVKWGINVLMGVTMLSTLSTAGIIEFAALFIVMFFAQGWYRSKKAVLISAGIILALIIAYKVIHWIDGPIWGEIWMIKQKFKNGGQSVTDRFGSISANAALFLHHPIFGNGVRTVLYNPAIDNNTSSSTILFAMFGLLGGLVHVFSWIVLAWKKGRFFVWNLAIAFVLALSFNSENLIADVFLWLFPMMAVCEKILPQLRKKESS